MTTNKPPWIRETDKTMFQTGNTGNTPENRARYDYKWRKESAKFRLGKRCADPNCLILAELTDHIIPVERGGAMYDRRNWNPLCHKHHNRKRAAESRGKIPESVQTDHGLIPKDRAHLPPDIVG